MKQPIVHSNDADPERALVSERRRLGVINREHDRMQQEIESLLRQQKENDHRAIVLCAEITRLEKLIKERGKL